ncbi:type II toxin-antitoxin system CcdA family antitoxin [Roseococcus sp. SDR]|uniref:type II toxin-antitoxin system CcdA family antitoxin n=1 Tax=Roseococcus sp. SDR TaxID=2835532 RepID=UPI001BCED8C7|nr:type II toxin-antitoxin system CcdA family antitoxin [Roseococcus sp. SDR]MBS7792406.1 type II toxin-antitoxin system CcdA family antitoxin [Roseococcus sp. SDR]MBV1847720.1 type II toxin-antitoxin system CcdA family antitoxin [Roseococcus sp. SDR]
MKLAEYLERTDTTLQALGEKLGVSHTTVLRWATGQAVPRGRARMEALARATQGAVTAADFFPEAAPAQTGLAETQTPFAAEAEALGLDAAAIAARAVQEAIRAEKARRWLAENAEAIEAWNRWTESNELPLAEYRMF